MRLATLLWFILSCFGLFTEQGNQGGGYLGFLFNYLAATGIAVDKIAHFVMFYGQTLLLFTAYKAYLKHYGGILLLLLWGWAGLSEILQFYLTVTRSAEWGDFAADTLGIFLGIIFFLGAHAAENNPKKEAAA